MVACKIRSGNNALIFDEFAIIFRRAFKTDERFPGALKADHSVDFARNSKEQAVPLNIFGCMRECETIPADPLNIHATDCKRKCELRDL